MTDYKVGDLVRIVSNELPDSLKAQYEEGQPFHWLEVGSVATVQRWHPSNFLVEGSSATSGRTVSQYLRLAHIEPVQA